MSGDRVTLLQSSSLAHTTGTPDSGDSRSDVGGVAEGASRRADSWIESREHLNILQLVQLLQLLQFVVCWFYDSDSHHGNIGKLWLCHFDFNFCVLNRGRTF
jgi:hypothetical protein